MQVISYKGQIYATGFAPYTIEEYAAGDELQRQNPRDRPCPFTIEPFHVKIYRGQIHATGPVP